ncbi:diacylglycerol kinase [Aquabacterium fontiphilum]|jgi:diacylglycerol kinase|uniref:diacylglycerol kinase n=1 Tax=Aquabacterium fontiphilum TaxID=450365 RepID=UPI0013784AD2|nr:diacylglycerol kinase [Aquabacterium fontiphilum]NBD21406.1 diacylglycerol kinase [Aquabacterium fontiphilum]
MKGASFLTRLGHARDGLRAAVAREPSMKTHVAAAAVVGVSLVWAGSPPVWWAVMAVTVAMVFACELMNTALEALCDHLHPQRHPAIKMTKDVAAAAVLLSSVGALAVGVAFAVDQLWPIMRTWAALR